MTFPRRFFLAFTGLALLLVCCVIAYSAYLDFRLSASITTCQETGRRMFVVKQSAEKLPPKINVLYDGLRAADANGDVSTARKLAAQIQAENATTNATLEAKTGQDGTAEKSHLVNIVGVGQLQFPSGMSNAEMAAAIQKNFPKTHVSPLDVKIGRARASGYSDAEILAYLGKTSDTSDPSATFTMTGVDGKHYSIDGPAGATKEQAAAVIQKSLGFSCEPDELREMSLRPDPKISSDGPVQVLEAYRSKQAALRPSAAYLLALSLLGIGAMPALWYFFLLRLSEIATALRGK